MEDLGAKWTDEKIAELEERIASLYSEAYDEVREKYLAFCRRFERDDKKYSEQLKEGKITAATYRDWLRGQVFQRKRWQAQLDDLAKTLTRTNQIAMDIINGEVPGVMAMNANWAEFQIEKAGNIDMGFGLYDEDTVKQLLRDEPNLLPPSRVDIPKDERWNMKAITRQINLGILMGERLDDIAKRLQRVADMNANQAKTHARTAMTGAQNAGRIEGYHRAQEMGIKLEKEWLATLDKRTRHAHAALDGQHVPVDESFKSELGKIMYPGDPNARPANVYNCRCTLISRLLDYPSENAKRRPNLQEYGDALPQKPIKDMTYAEWAGWKEKNQKAGMYRQAKNTGAFAHLPERMSKKHVREVAKKYGISLNKVNLEIVPDPELLKLKYKVYGCAAPEKIGSLYLYPSAFESEEQLTRTLIHEKIHIEQFRKHGAEHVMNNNDEFEKEAYDAEKEFAERMRREGRF